MHVRKKEIRMFKKNKYIVRIATTEGKKEYKAECKSRAHAIMHILEHSYCRPYRKEANKIIWIDVLEKEK